MIGVIMLKTHRMYLKMEVIKSIYLYGRHFNNFRTRTETSIIYYFIFIEDWT